MFKNKKFIFSLLALALLITHAQAYYEPNDKSFKDGFEAGLAALEFQAKNEGFSSRVISLTKPYTLLLDIKEMPLSEVLFLQVLASREGIQSHLSEEFLYLGSFEREVDAKDRIKNLVSKFKLNAKNLKVYSKIKEFITYPYLYKGFYESLLSKAKNEGVIVETKILQKPIIKPSPIIKKANPQIIKKPSFTLKNAKAMSYKSLGGSENDAKNYAEVGLKSKQNFFLEKRIKTNLGESFVKVAGLNLYFLESDITMLSDISNTTNTKTTTPPCVRLCQ